MVVGLFRIPPILAVFSIFDLFGGLQCSSTSIPRRYGLHLTDDDTLRVRCRCRDGDGLGCSLTGEGHAREKVVAALGSVSPRGDQAEDAGPVSHGRRAIPLAECKNMVFMGTLACGGHARAVVVATGKQTPAPAAGSLSSALVWMSALPLGFRGLPPVLLSCAAFAWIDRVRGPNLDLSGCCFCAIVRRHED